MKEGWIPFDCILATGFLAEVEEVRGAALAECAEGVELDWDFNSSLEPAEKMNI